MSMDEETMDPYNHHPLTNAHRSQFVPPFRHAFSAALIAELKPEIGAY
jgi:hypothetical protein